MPELTRLDTFRIIELRARLKGMDALPDSWYEQAAVALNKKIAVEDHVALPNESANVKTELDKIIQEYGSP